MQNKNLLQAIWGNDKGIRFVCTMNTDGNMSNHAFSSTDAAIQFAADSSQRGLNFFFAPALFHTEQRKKTNVVGVRTLFLDIDLGSSKPYLDQSEAQLALSEFVTSLRLPDPVMVMSGHGIHAYFILATPVGPQEWNELAG